MTSEQLNMVRGRAVIALWICTRCFRNDWGSVCYITRSVPLSAAGFLIRKEDKMRVFNCTVKDIAFRSKALDMLTSSMAANGYKDARADYMLILTHWNEALNCASVKTGSEKSRIALRYLSGNITIDRISDLEFYNNRTVRRYIREFCECIRLFYLERFDIALAQYC